MEFNQIYKAPAIPKLGRRNIKSALITGAVKSRLSLNKTKFSFSNSFVKPKVENNLTDNLNLIVKKEEDTDKKFSIIESFLGSTNKILVQVQNQLAFDNLSRIAAEKAQLEKDKKRISRKKVSDKERKIEEPGKNSILPKIFDRVTAPIKSIFQKLIDFFSIILTGLIVNNAFNWLSKKENREKLKKFFDFVVDHWKEILIILGTAKLLSVLLKVVGAAKALKGLIDLFKKKPPGGGLGGASCADLARCFATSPVFVNAFDGFLTSNPRVYNTIQGIAGGRVPTPGPAPVPPLLGPAGKPLNLPPVAGIPTRQPQSQPAFQSQGNPSWIDGILQGMGNSVSSIITTLLSVAAALSMSPARAQELPSKATGGTILEKPKKKCTACSMGFSGGGTVGKGDRPGTDTVPAMVRGGARIMLDADEEVINAKSSRVWRPTLKDINDNGARMWSQFVEGIKKQESTNTVQAENNTRFAKVLEDYDKVLKEEERRLRNAMLKNKPTRPGGAGGQVGRAAAAPTPVTSGGGGGGASPTSSAPATSGGAVAPTPTSGGGGNNRAMPEASKPGALGDPGNPNSPRIGEQVGSLPPQKSTAKPKTSTLPNNFEVKSASLPSWIKSNDLYKKDSGIDISQYTRKPTFTSLNFPLPPNVIDNSSKVGSLPAPGGDPTPLRTLSSTNPLNREDIAYNAIALGIC